MTLFDKLAILSLFAVMTFGRHILIERSIPDKRDETIEESISNEEDIFINSTEENECICNHRYFQHYAVKGCVIEEQDSCGCPKKFSCPQNRTSHASSNVCVHDNKEYPVGAKIPTSSVCRICYCRDEELGPHMSCISIECPPLEPPTGENCVLVYKEEKCCPVSYKCASNETEDDSDAEANQTCEYGGIQYSFGSRIYLESDRCKICTCNKNWNGDNSTCDQIDCLFETRSKEFEAGCIPIYHEKVCCPIEFYCPSSHNFSYSLIPSNETENSKSANGDKCSFGDQHFGIGYVVPIENPCVSCTCLVPPELTCIHKTCPPSPSEEYCQPIFKQNECCPSYDCLYADAEVPADPGACPTPLCEDSSCRIETPPGHQCPTCVCGYRFSELEHNNVQQRVQQISQNIEPFQEVYVGNGETENDFSSDQLQMMPIRMQDSEGDFSAAETIYEPLSENSEEGLEKEMNINDDSYSEIESSDKPSEFLENDEDNLVIGSELDESERESNSKEVQKRSETPQESTVTQFGIPGPIQQEQSFGQFPEKMDDLEREGSEPENDEEFEDEVESFQRRLLKKNDTTINEIININHVVEVSVPPGCPTPLCEGPWCKIGIPEGHKCPTCICKRPTEP